MFPKSRLLYLVELHCHLCRQILNLLLMVLATSFFILYHKLKFSRVGFKWIYCKPFKVMLPPRSENLSCCSTKLIHVCKKLRLHWIAGRANILSIYIYIIYFNFGRGFYGPFPMLFSKASTSCWKKNLN